MSSSLLQHCELPATSSLSSVASLEKLLTSAASLRALLGTKRSPLGLLTRSLDKALSCVADSPCVVSVLAGVTGTLAGALVDGDLVVRQQAAQCMVHIAGSQKGCADLCDNGVVLKLVAMVSHGRGPLFVSAC